MKDLRDWYSYLERSSKDARPPSDSGNFIAPAAPGRLPPAASDRPLVRRPATDNVQDLWRRYGWVPPTEMGKNFRATLRNTATA